MTQKSGSKDITRRDKKSRLLSSLVCLALVSLSFLTCTRPFEPGIAEESKVYMLNRNLMLSRSLDDWYIFDADRSYDNSPELLTEFYELPPELSRRVIGAINHDYIECALGKNIFLRSKGEGFLGLLLRVENEGKVSYWGWALHLDSFWEPPGLPYEGGKVFMRQALFSVTPAFRGSDRLEFTYGHRYCFRSELTPYLFKELYEGKFRRVKLPLPDKSNRYEIKALNQEGKIVTGLFALLIGFFGGYINARILIPRFSKTSDWSNKKKNQVALIYAAWAGLIAFVAFMA